MEWLAIIISGLFTAITPAGLILDTVIANSLRSQVADVEALAVRIDNTPSYQALQGKIDRVRIATRGIEPIAGLQIAELELETDPLTFDIDKLQAGEEITNPQTILKQPLQAAIRFVITETDINQALGSPEIKEQLQNLLDSVIPQSSSASFLGFKIMEIRINFLANDRSQIYVKLLPQVEDSDQQAESEANPIEVELESGFAVLGGRSLQILDPEGKLNGRKLSKKLLQGFAEGLSEDLLDLRQLQKQGITLRILQFEINENSMEVASFLRIEPESSKLIDHNSNEK